jgi:F-type H+-transporting ATPase subunit b
MMDLSNPKFWIMLAFVLLVVTSYKKLAAVFASAMDGRADKIKSELEKARALRVEAEAVLALYKQKQAEFAKEAESILSKAREDANHISAHAEAELKAAIDARTKYTIEKIAQEEQAAIVDIRNHVVDIALAAARSIIVDQMSSLSQDELVKLAIADIERKVH